MFLMVAYCYGVVSQSKTSSRESWANFAIRVDIRDGSKERPERAEPNHALICDICVAYRSVERCVLVVLLWNR
jgi:hypothetical protein